MRKSNSRDLIENVRAGNGADVSRSEQLGAEWTGELDESWADDTQARNKACYGRTVFNTASVGEDHGSE
jgi:hypothetical protein